MSGATAFTEPPEDQGVSRRLAVALAVVVTLVAVAGAAAVWVYSRPAPLAEAVPGLPECFPAPDSEYATYGTLTIENRSDEPIKIRQLKIIDPRGVIITGVPMLVPMIQETIGNQPGYPPTSGTDRPGLAWAAQQAVVNGMVPPAATAGLRNVVVGVRLFPNVPDPSFSGIELVYEAGWRTHTWRSETPVVVRTTGSTC
jgi:hypothetical protein